MIDNENQLKNPPATLAGQALAYLPHLDAEPPDEVGGNVTMSRALAESAHGLTLNEARVMMLAMRCINPRSSPHQYGGTTGYVKVRVHAAEFAELANMGETADGYTPRAAYAGLKSACDKLYERSAGWTEGKKQIRMRWAWKAEYHEKEAWAEIHFSPDLTRHIFMLGERFVRYRLEFARGLAFTRGRASIRHAGRARRGPGQSTCEALNHISSSPWTAFSLVTNVKVNCKL